MLDAGLRCIDLDLASMLRAQLLSLNLSLQRLSPPLLSLHLELLPKVGDSQQLRFIADIGWLDHCADGTTAIEGRRAYEVLRL